VNPTQHRLAASQSFAGGFPGQPLRSVREYLEAGA